MKHPTLAVGSNDFYEPELLTVAIYECDQAGRQRFYLLLRVLDSQAQQEYPISVSGNFSALQTLKCEITIPSNGWSKAERLRLKKGYKKKALLDINESRIYEALPLQIVRYRQLLTLVCEKTGVSTRKFKTECKLAYFLFPDAKLKLITPQDIHVPETEEEVSKILREVEIDIPDY